MIALLAILVSGAAAEVQAGCQDLSWQSHDPYSPPDFAAYFPDDEAGAAALEALWQSAEWGQQDVAALLVAVRNGLNRYMGDPAPILRWVGATCIRNLSQQQPDAIELMYHAAGAGVPDGARPDIREPAIYFGLALVRPKSSAVLQVLVDAAMQSDDPRELSRITWGLGEERGEALRLLKRYIQHTDPKVAEKAQIVDRIFRRELKAFDWARGRHRDELEARYGDTIPALVEALRNGDSAVRHQILEQMEREDTLLIVTPDFLRTLRLCASDPDTALRQRVARIVGNTWVWDEPDPPFDAVDLLLALSRDPRAEVRYDAVRFGLSVIAHKERAVIQRLLEMAIDEDKMECRNGAMQALRGQREAVVTALGQVQSGADSARGHRARILLEWLTTDTAHD